jgi:ActR/RegA family two-component response regulator
MRLPDSPLAAGPAVFICLTDEVFRDAVVTVAEDLGYMVSVHVRLGSDLVELFERTQPTAAVVDLALLGEDGLGTIRRIRQAAPATTIVLSSPFASVVASGADSGAHHVVSEGDVAGVRASLPAVGPSLPPRPSTAGKRSTKAPSS